MQRVSGANFLANAFGIGKSGYQDYNAAIGQAGTTPNASALNALQEEIASYIEAQGLVLDANDNTQLAQALAIMLAGFAPLISPALTGNPTAPTQASADSSTKLATTAFVHALMPIAQLGQAGTLAFPNGPVVQWDTFSATTGTTAFNGVYESPAIPVAWPEPFPNSCFGVLAGPYDVTGTGYGEQAWFSPAPSKNGGTGWFGCKFPSQAMSGFYIAIGD